MTKCYRVKLTWIKWPLCVCVRARMWWVWGLGSAGWLENHLWPQQKSWRCNRVQNKGVLGSLDTACFARLEKMQHTCFPCCIVTGFALESFCLLQQQQASQIFSPQRARKACPSKARQGDPHWETEHTKSKFSRRLEHYAYLQKGNPVSTFLPIPSIQQ
jgi:hypothetical protein